MNTCVQACESLGPWGPIVFGVLAFAWGQWKAWQASRMVSDARTQLSQRPPVQHIYYSQPPATMPADIPKPPPVPKFPTPDDDGFEEDLASVMPTVRPRPKKPQP